MKGLVKIPSQKDFLKAYRALQSSPHSVRADDLVRWSQWSRLDPRLGELLVERIAKFWPECNPTALNRRLKKCVWPAVFGVLIEQVPFYFLQNPKSAVRDKKLFLHWSKCVMADILPADNEQFFIGLYKPGGKLAKEECFYALKPYRRWGYFSKDLMINKAASLERTLISARQREALLNELLKFRKKIKVGDYLEKLNFQIHRRQAQRDLKNCKRLKACGQTKNRYWTAVKRKRSDALRP